MFAVLGSQGQLGRDLLAVLPADTLALTRADIDLDNPETVTSWFATHRPSVFINCSAYNLVDKAESESEVAFRVNAWGPYALAKACRAAGVRFVHVSTDYVFGLDEDRTTPLAETDAPGPVSIYGLSKLNGEHLVRMVDPTALVIRTCGLYGLHGSGGKGGNFVETMLRVAGQGKPLRVVADQHCMPTFAVDLARMIRDLIAKSCTGLVHAVNDGATTWHNFAAEIFRLAGTSVDLTPIATAEYPTPARRPKYSVLSTAKLQAMGIRPRPWREALSEYLALRGTKSN